MVAYACGGQISDIQVSGQSEDMTAKEKLLLWSQRMVEGYQGLHCDNFTTSWRDGRLFNAIIHRHRCVGQWAGGCGKLRLPLHREAAGAVGEPPPSCPPPVTAADPCWWT